MVQEEKSVVELVEHNLVIPVHSLPTDKAWSVLYDDGSVLVENALENIWWDNINWSKLVQINIMGVIITPPCNKISFCREAVAAYGQNAQTTAIKCVIEYNTHTLVITFKSVKE